MGPRLDQENIQRLREMRPTIDELLLIDMKRDYATFRKRWFGVSIPPVEAMMFGLTDAPVMESATGQDCLGFYISEKLDGAALSAIVIARDADLVIRRMTMLHEMAHLKVDLKWGREMGHGNNWQTEMKRLARIGAFKNNW